MSGCDSATAARVTLVTAVGGGSRLADLGRNLHAVGTNVASARLVAAYRGVATARPLA